MNISVRELKNHLSEYLRRVEAGEELVITSHGRPKARLVAMSDEQEGESEASAVERIRALPFMSRGGDGRVQGSAHPIRVEKGEKGVAEIVNEDRD